MKNYLQFDDGDWERTERRWTAWWQGELDRPMVVVEAMSDPSYTIDTYADHLTRFPLTIPVDAIIDRVEPQLESLLCYGDAFPKWYPNFGPGILAAFLGSPVSTATGTTWFHPAGWSVLGDVRLGYSVNHPWHERVSAVALAASAAWGDRVVVGHPDIGGNLDTLAALRGTQQLLVDLYDTPDEVERLVEEVTGLWLGYYHEYHGLVSPHTRPGTACWGPWWAPGTSYMLNCDFATMISPAMFERLVLPDLVACCDDLEYAFYHLDGKGQIRHLDMLLSIPRLRGIQWIPGAGAPPPEAWIPLLKRIRDAGKLCQVYVTPDGAARIAHELGGKGFLFYIGDTTFLTPGEADACCTYLQAEGLMDR